MKKIFALLICLSFTSLHAQTPQKLNAAEIHESIKKLNFLGSVLYIAAHPDDENTRLISYLSNKIHARTGYLSLTRGDGGQNLIGPEIRELLGVIRTQELLAARRIDGGNQFFTRAIDFGYTKTPDETLNIWNKDQVLSDVVWTIRNFKPDVIINRFNHRTSGDTHGQHTASALLSVEAFDLAGDKTAFQDQLALAQTHYPKRLFFNTSPWFYGSDKAFEKADKSNFLKFETGVYFPSQGLSNPEIAALSRSSHRSQGFGSAGSRGSQLEYIELIAGEMPKDTSNLFDGIDTSWNRIEGGKEIGEILTNVQANYNFKDPSASLPELAKAYSLLDRLDNGYWKQVKIKEIKEIIAACAGLYLDAKVSSANASPGEDIEVSLEAINRSNSSLRLVSVNLSTAKSSSKPGIDLTNNIGWSRKLNLRIPENAEYTTPYWLRSQSGIGMYNVKDQNLIGLPETPRDLNVEFKILVEGTEIPFTKNILYEYTDDVKGEIIQPFEIVPAVSVKFNEKVMIFPDEASKKISVVLTSQKEKAAGTLKLQVPDTWKLTPEVADFEIEGKGASKTFQFNITPPNGASESEIIPIVTIGNKKYSDEVVTIDYDHIPFQSLIVPAKTKLVKLNIKKKGDQIGYIAGAGDVVPESLEQIGYKVTLLDVDTITAKNLAKYDALVIGIRAYNIVETLKFKQAELLKYAFNGGTLIVQYNNNRGILTNKLAPYKLELSRDRVTEEDAEVSFLEPEASILNTPNKITAADFNNWVQERGLYFPDSWGKEFTPVLSMHDTNEEPMKGSLLISEYGKGYFIYTGLSFFRQFPEGVPGAYRLFANLVSIGK
ncbi:GlcNAc-PI de-N-acetylase [Gillisia sp. Hel1_33_143]|uniref:PIG-L family deacetylase n=1 Tax=Gillisia sp. Hel1_33_143 TaxID=1336796 RepID=UPI00087B5CA2|nr:PIG-L family deacetylase [Gillisia sp. Hel1_33_143]SDS63947.1 GlcNAc-PI de-N-acetylase [Gillisia sp. Hel1_33_143]